MSDANRDQPDLERCFEAARANPPDTSAGLMARVLADAEALQRVDLTGTPRWRTWLAALGGWPAVAGLGLAACAGLWIGIAPPLAIGDAVLVLTGSDFLGTSGDLFGTGSFDLAVLEG